jgi:hypothetical protein
MAEAAGYNLWAVIKKILGIFNLMLRVDGHLRNEFLLRQFGRDF